VRGVECFAVSSEADRLTLSLSLSHTHKYRVLTKCNNSNATDYIKPHRCTDCKLGRGVTA